MNKKIQLLLILLCCLWNSMLAEPMTLSMQAAIAAALDKNYAISIERIEPEIAQEGIREARGRFDPVLQSQYLYRNNELTGFTRDQESASFEFGIGSTLPWGTQVEAAIRTNDQTTPFDPFTNEYSEQISTSINTFAGITVTQPVLRGYGLDSNLAELRIARENSDSAWEVFRAQVMDTVAATVTAYQNLYFAQQNLVIAERNRDLALQLLDDNKKRVETGAMAPLDIVQAESEAALREVSVISAGAFLKQAENELKGLIWDNPDSVLDLQIKILPPEEPARFTTDPQRDYQLALEYLPEYRANQAGVNIRKLEVKQIQREALPQLDLIGSAGRQAIRDGFSDSFDGAFGDGEASFTVGAVFSMPFPNRTRSARKARAYLRRNQAEMGVKQLEQVIRLELDNSATQLSADWQRIQAARRARELSEKSLLAEEKKLQVGTSTTFVVLRLQGDLATAEIRETNALTDYNISLARYQRARGRILEFYNVNLSNSGN